MFWTNPKIKAIETASMENGEERRTMLQANVNGTEVVLDMPRAVVVDPQAGNDYFPIFLSLFSFFLFFFWVLLKKVS